MASIQSWRVTKLYILLLASLLVFAQVPFFMVFFIYKEYVPQKHIYAVFVTGIAVVFECIATDILVFVTA
ncbi:hypothetical protein GBAR_LOCUS10679 [Geodia barretti]|uniref:Uncharacterized protein n=1 Tax=Geodia barretti TaxID=519541 RepID=A0AA35RWP3_GEOBA|nr:hypothetical protein GBAR_LOCUS10679 [Geodia barretti]